MNITYASDFGGNLARDGKSLGPQHHLVWEKIIDFSENFGMEGENG
jgi:hypothetical protein